MGVFVLQQSRPCVKVYVAPTFSMGGKSFLYEKEVVPEESCALSLIRRNRCVGLTQQLLLLSFQIFQNTALIIRRWYLFTSVLILIMSNDFLSMCEWLTWTEDNMTGDKKVLSLALVGVLLVHSVVAQTDNEYEDCGTTKGCLGLPANCVTSEDCKLFVTGKR